MKDNVIIADLDDTLVSTHLRQYSCIKDYLTDAGKEFIDFDTYFDLRRGNNYSNTKLLESLNIDLDWDAFRAFYLANIESQKYLALDQLIVDKKLLSLARQKGYTLILLSLRSNHLNSTRQLQQLGIAEYFSDTYFEYHDAAINAKLNRLKLLKAAHNIIAFCGDSGADYEAAEILNINFVQVKTALYNLPGFKKATAFENINQYFLSIL